MDIRKTTENAARVAIIVLPIVVIVGIVWVFVGKFDFATQEVEQAAPPVGSRPWKFERPARKHYPMVHRATQSRMIAEAASEAQPASAVETNPEQPVVAAPKPHRTFITIENYQIENNGEGPSQPISNVRLQIKFPGQPVAEGEKKPERLTVNMPRGGDYWPIGNGQMIDIKQTFEIPYEYIVKDGFELQVQMDRKGAWIKPCKFKIKALSQFNRKYICRIDEKWQRRKGISDERLDKELIEVRVFTDLHPLPKDKGIPKDVIAIR